MNTPICDFVSSYIASGSSRLHMPGHKGHGPLFIEQRDITEISGADILSEASGIIGESQANAAQLFGSGMTLYSTEGSSLAIRAMLFLALQRFSARSGNSASGLTPAAHTASSVRRSVAPRSADAASRRPVVLAARNAHKSFLYACALLDCEIEWIYPKEHELSSVCACHPTAAQVSTQLRAMETPPFAVYLTSPDYLGTEADIREITDAVDAVYGKNTVPVLVDNAHGAYLHFLATPRHPLDLGAYMCCDSTHKTLPVLTGGAYLHFSRTAAGELGGAARHAMALFGSTSPSYLILQSLDFCNAYLCDNYEKRLAACIRRVDGLKSYLRMLGITIPDSEPLKLVIDAAPRTGTALASLFRKYRIEPEFADVNYVVCMFTPDNATQDFLRLAELYRDVPEIWNLPTQSAADTPAPAASAFHAPQLRLKPLQRALSVREAIFASQEEIDVRKSAGRICAQPTVSCPPAIPIAVSGELIDASLIPVFLAYGIGTVSVVR